MAKRKLQNPGSKLQAPCSERQNAEILGILHKWGIHTLGQLATLDREELRTRLGNEAVRLWERANGTATRLLKLIQPPETFEESFEFDHEIETAEPLLFMLRRFLEQLTLRLNAIYLVARELTLTITFSSSRQYEPAVAGKQSYERVFKIPQPTNDVDLLFRMLQTHLENFKSEHPIVAVALIANPIRRVSQQFGLFETALKNPQQLFETLARLTALLGNERVGTPVLEETHRPDAFRMEAFMWNFHADEFPHRLAAASAPLPLSHRERRTQSASEGKRVGLGEGRVRANRIALRRFRPPARTAIFISEHRHLESDKIRGQIIDQKGPYLLSGNWWDEKAWVRAEWDMQLENGELIRTHECGGKWRVDGIYD